MQERIPIELVLDIIGKASQIPAIALTRPTNDPLTSVDTLQLRNQEILKSLSQILRTKLSMSLVSRAWRNITREFMYEFLIIRDVKAIPLLVETLTRLKRNTQIRPIPTLRLDLLCTSSHRTHILDGITFTHPRLALKLITMCPQLRVLTCACAELLCMEAQLIARYLEQSFITLNYLAWRGDFSNITLMERPDGSKLLYRAALFDFSKPLTGNQWPQSILPLNDYFDTLLENSPRSSYPCLADGKDDTHIHLVLGDPIQTRNFTHFIVQAPSINILSFSKGAFLIPTTGLPLCLHTLIFFIADIPSNLPTSLPYVRNIGLRGMSLPAKDLDYYLGRLIGEGNPGSSEFPNLAIIRLIDSGLVDSLRNRPYQHRLWDRRLRAQGIELQDESGCSVSLKQLY